MDTTEKDVYLFVTKKVSQIEFEASLTKMTTTGDHLVITWSDRTKWTKRECAR